MSADGNLSGKTLREIYTESCKKFGCKRNSAVYQLLSDVPDDFDGIEELDLSNNLIGSKGTLALLGVLSACRRLARLSLRGNSLDYKAVTELAQVLKLHPSLTKLDLSNNRVGTAGKALLDMLRQNSRVLELVLENTYIDSYMMKKINERLAANRVAASVWTGGNVEGARAPIADGKLEPSSDARALTHSAPSLESHTAVISSPHIASSSAASQAPTSSGSVKFFSAPLPPSLDKSEREQIPVGTPSAVSAAPSVGSPTAVSDVSVAELVESPATSGISQASPEPCPEPPKTPELPTSTTPSCDLPALSSSILPSTEGGDSRAVVPDAAEAQSPMPPTNLSQATPISAEATVPVTLQDLQPRSVETSAAEGGRATSAEFKGRSASSATMGDSTGLIRGEGSASKEEVELSHRRVSVVSGQISESEAGRGEEEEVDSAWRSSAAVAVGLPPEGWWASAVPFPAAPAASCSAPTPELLGEDVDWAHFDLTALFDVQRYHTFLPIATKLLQLRMQSSTDRPPSHLLDDKPASDNSSEDGDDEDDDDDEEEEDEEEEDGEEEEEEENNDDDGNTD
eukprot:RCo009774